MNATAIHTHAIAPTVTRTGAMAYFKVSAYIYAIRLNIPAPISANNAEEYSTNFINVFMVVRFNSRNKGGIGTPYFNYLRGLVHASTRLVNASTAAKVSTTIVNLSGNEFPHAYATSNAAFKIINDTPKNAAVKSMINSRIIVDFGG